MGSEKKVLAFDLGNVLFGFDYSIALRRIEDKIMIGMVYFTHSHWLTISQGLNPKQAGFILFLPRLLR